MLVIMANEGTESLPHSFERAAIKSDRFQQEQSNKTHKQ